MNFAPNFFFKGLIFLFFKAYCGIQMANERKFGLVFLVFPHQDHMQFFPDYCNREKHLNGSQETFFFFKGLSLICVRTNCDVLNVISLIQCNRLSIQLNGCGLRKLGRKIRIGLLLINFLKDLILIFFSNGLFCQKA